jgi:hypothetical protein
MIDRKNEKTTTMRETVTNFSEHVLTPFQKEIIIIIIIIAATKTYP